MTKPLLSAVCIAIIVVVNIQNDYSSTTVNVLVVIGIVVVLHSKKNKKLAKEILEV